MALLQSDKFLQLCRCKTITFEHRAKLNDPSNFCGGDLNCLGFLVKVIVLLTSVRRKIYKMASGRCTWSWWNLVLFYVCDEATGAPWVQKRSRGPPVRVGTASGAPASAARRKTASKDVNALCSGVLWQVSGWHSLPTWTLFDKC